MRVPFQVRVAAVVAGVGARDFVAGWVDGLARWKLAHGGDIPPNQFDRGSTRWAASEAAVTFMIERS